ncbi:hypothetical protein J2754_000088 [Halarchaeum solikamskense]|nr:hypothetical protein [Halarchaeum solikamskense]
MTESESRTDGPTRRDYPTYGGERAATIVTGDGGV